MRALILTSLVLTGCVGELLGPRLDEVVPPGAPGEPPKDPPPPVPFEVPACNPMAAPPASPLRRMTRDEVVATVAVLLPNVDVSDLSARLPADDLSRGVATFDVAFSELHTTTLLELAVVAAERATSTDARVNALLAPTCTLATLTDPCARATLDAFAARAWRRPLTSAERDTLWASYQTGVDARDRFAVALGTALAMPDVWYHLELGAPGVGSDTRFALTAYERANRLSFALLGAPPPPWLVTEAQAGRLSTSLELDSAAARLMTDPRTKGRVQAFFSTWLKTVNAPGISSNPTFLAGVDSSGLRAEMLRELDEYLERQVWDARVGFEALMSSRISYARTPALAGIYGHALSADPTLGTQLMESGRKGLLLRAPFLISTDDFTHPITRGARLRQDVLCDELGAPSAEAASALSQILDPALLLTLTGRQRFDAKTSVGACAGCHRQINPLGFALEGFDSLGRQRTLEISYDANDAVLATHPVDVTVSDLNIDFATGEQSTRGEELIDTIATSTRASYCMARQAHRFFTLRREQLGADACELAAVRERLTGGSIIEGLETLAATAAGTDKVVTP